MMNSLVLLAKNINLSQAKVCAIVVLMGLIFLLPALENGFPFTYFDTNVYVSAAVDRYLPKDRPIWYGIFTTIFDLRQSPWPSICVQSLITAMVVWRFAAAVFGLECSPRVLVIAAFLTISTSLPWFVGQIMPDIFTPLMILALTLLLVVPDTIARLSTIMLAIVISIAVAFHQANLLVALWVFPAAGLCALLGWRPSRRLLCGLWASVVAVLLGVAALFTANLAGGRFALSSGGSVFFMARLLEDGPALWYLERTCPQQHFTICQYLDELESYHSTTLSYGDRSVENTLMNYFLWYGPLDKLGGFRGEQAEAATIVAGTISTYPVAVLRQAVANSWKQLLRFHTGDGLFPFPEVEPVSVEIKHVFGPVIYDHYRQSEQIRGVLGYRWFDALNRIHTAVVVGSFLVLMGFIVFRGFQEQPRAFYATIVVIVLVIGNAITLGNLSGPYDRFQSRVIWLVPLLATCVVLQRFPYLGQRPRNAISA